MAEPFTPREITFGIVGLGVIWYSARVVGSLVTRGVVAWLKHVWVEQVLPEIRKLKALPDHDPLSDEPKQWADGVNEDRQMLRTLVDQHWRNHPIKLRSPANGGAGETQ